MAASRLGSAVLLVGGIHTILVFTMWVGTFTFSPAELTWFDTIIQSSAFWLPLSSSGILILYFGFRTRSGTIRFTDEMISDKAIIYSAAGIAVFSLLVVLSLASLFVVN